MSNEIATNETFQQRMFEKIRDQMGDLLTDDELKKLLANAVEKAFFEQTRGSYGREEPPLFVKLIQNSMQARIHSAVSEWMNENPELMEKAIQDVLKNGIFSAVMNVFEQRMSHPLHMFAENLRQQGVLR